MTTPTGLQHVKRLFQDAMKQGLWTTAVRFARMREFKFGTLIGQDVFGNKYYEDLQEVGGRHRWVEYPGGLPWEKPKDATTVPPEWHGWLHYINDNPGNSNATLSMTPLRFKREHLPNATATDKAYSPHNFLLNRNYGKQKAPYTVWEPNNHTSARK